MAARRAGLTGGASHGPREGIATIPAAR